MSRVTYTPEERRARLESAHDELTSAIETIATGDEWRNFLNFAGKLHRYSAGNRFWLYAQAMQRGWDELGHVAGYRTWLSLDRHVMKGEKGLRVLAPCRYKVKDAATGDESWQVRGFTVETVFAARQTDGDGAIPTNPTRPELLTGDGPMGAYEALADLARSKGFSIKREAMGGGMNGYTQWATLTVAIGDHLDDAAATKTMAHELAHVLLHGPGQVDYFSNRERCEVEAESVAYLVCGELGLESDQYSFPYVASWAKGETKVVTATADTAIKCANEVLEALAVPELAEVAA